MSVGNPEDIRRAYELGVADYVTKAPTLQEWSKRACGIRDFWLKQNTAAPWPGGPQ